MRWWIRFLFTAIVAALGISGHPIVSQQNDHSLQPKLTQTSNSNESPPQDINHAVSLGRPIQGRRGFHRGPLFESFSPGLLGSNLTLIQPSSLLENSRRGLSHQLPNLAAVAEIKEISSTAVNPQLSSTVAGSYLDSDNGYMPRVLNSSRLPLSIIKAIAEHANVRVASGLLDYEDTPAIETNKHHITITKMVDVSDAIIGTTTLPSRGRENAKNTKENTDLVPGNKFAINNSKSTATINPMSTNFSENLIIDGYSDFFLEEEYFSPETLSQTFDIKDAGFPRVTKYSMVISSIIPCEEECHIRMEDTWECKKDYACLFKRSAGWTKKDG